MNYDVESVTNAIRDRSHHSRKSYLEKIGRAAEQGPDRTGLPCSNLAHGIAACSSKNKSQLLKPGSLNIGIVSAYNDMLSAHQPYERYPDQIRKIAAKQDAVVQFAGGVPAMCDGVTQGQEGMDLSLFSRDVIAMATAVALSHNMFDGVICLGICDKIVPGLLMGSLAFGHLPVIFIPAGPMPSGLPNKDKARVREQYAEGTAGRDELLAAESASYHSPGTCTFYGTANSNQMLMEFMGLQLPGGSFVNPGTSLREALTAQATRQILFISKEGKDRIPLGHILDEKTIVNAMVGLLATGGSTNHTLHLVAIAKAAGIEITWQDFARLSAITPLLARVYPNGMADVNHFHDAGGLGFLIAELLDAGLLHEDVMTVMGKGLDHFTKAPAMDAENLNWNPVSRAVGDRSVIRTVDDPFQTEGGLQLLQGNIGKAIVKISAVDKSHQKVTAPARVFLSQEAFAEAYENGELEKDIVIVVRCQGPRANGMPELHKLTPYLGVLQNKGFKVALLTDGRMSGASGKVLSAIHVTPEAMAGGMIAAIRDGDVITIDAEAGVLDVEADLQSRNAEIQVELQAVEGMGRELFGVFRKQVEAADKGASVLFQE